MQPAGEAVLPDLDAPFVLAAEVAAALQADPQVWATFCAFPELYRRVRAGYVQEMSGDPVEFARRLNHLVAHTAKGERFGNWDDGGRLG